jgi:hypothetical protein
MIFTVIIYTSFLMLISLLGNEGKSGARLLPTPAIERTRCGDHDL